MPSGNGDRERYFLAKGVTGIGNRLLYLVYVVIYSRLTNRTALVDWRDGMLDKPGTNAFWTYFDPSPALQKVDLSSLDLIEDVNIAQWRHRSSLSVRDFAITLPEPLAFVNLHRHHILWDLEVPNRLVIGFGGKSGFQEMPEDLALNLTDSTGNREELQRQVLQSFYCPAQTVREATESALDQIKVDNCLGVHVRATDKQPDQTLEKIMDLVAGRQQSEGKPDILLATDSAAVLNAFQQRFGAAVRVCTPSERKSSDGQPLHEVDYASQSERQSAFVDAFVELNALARCDALVLQANSTFSRVALLLSGLTSGAVSWHSLDAARRLGRLGAQFRKAGGSVGSAARGGEINETDRRSGSVDDLEIPLF